MASGGKGRGRGILATKIQSVTQKPGEAAVVLNYERLLMQIKQLSINSDQTVCSEIVEASKSCTSTKVIFQNVIKAIHERALQDKQAAKIIADLCKKMIKLESENVSFRTVLLTLLEEDFNNKQLIRNSSRERFANSVAFLCEIFGAIQLASGEAIKVLINPIVRGMKMLLDNSATLYEVETCAEQLCSIGPLIKICNEEAIEDIFFSLRCKILYGNTTQNVQMRHCLLKALELYCHNWEPLPERIEKLYRSSSVPLPSHSTEVQYGGSHSHTCERNLGYSDHNSSSKQELSFHNNSVPYPDANSSVKISYRNSDSDSPFLNNSSFSYPDQHQANRKMFEKSKPHDSGDMKKKYSGDRSENQECWD